MTSRAGETELERDERYLALLVSAIRVCADYRPKLGKAKAGLTVDDFVAEYGADPFYHWMHLSAWSALSAQAGRIRCHAKGIELQEAVPVGVSA